MGEQIHLSRMASIITTECNLRCKLCSVGVPYLKERFQVSFNEFRDCLAAAFEIIDTVGSLEFGGGEPFLNENLPSMIEHYCELYSGRFNQWLVVTNGTIPINDKLMQVFRAYKENGMIHISDYGLNQKRVVELTGALDEIGIQYRVDQYYGDNQYSGGWLDPGQVKQFNRGEKALREIYSKCGIVKNGGCWRIYRGQLHFCTRSCRCTEFGVDLQNDYVSLTDDSNVEQRRNKLLLLINSPYLQCCDYCKGDLGTADLSKRFPAAQQITSD